MIATVTLKPAKVPVDWSQTDIARLHALVLTAMDKHFADYQKAAAAQREYGRVLADAEHGHQTLFGTAEAMRAGLSAHPGALRWAAFEREAAEGIAPCSFSIRFCALE